MPVAVLSGGQESTEQVDRVVSSMHQAGLLYPQLLTYRCGAANRRFGPCVDGSELARTILHVAGLVGAAMCSAFECGSHDRWP